VLFFVLNAFSEPFILDNEVWDIMNDNRSSQQNSIIRALKLLEVLKSGTDRKHKLTQEQLLSMMKKMDGHCTLKTMRTDLRNLMSAINPIVDETGDEYKDHPQDYRIVYDGIEEGRHRMSGIQYIHEFTNDELDLLIGLLKGSGGVSKESIDNITRKLKKQGSGFYQYTSDVIQTVPEHNTIDKTFINHNIWIIHAAIIHNKRIIFTFNGYGKDGKLNPVREKEYEVNPYYVVMYQQKYYMLCTHDKYEDVHIYRLDLMSDIELCEIDRESVRGVPELEHSNAKEYMVRHLNMFYDEPRTVVLKVNNSSRGYTSIHDQFGDKYIYKKKIDDEYDEIEVTASGNAIIDYAIRYSDLVEIIRPKELRDKLIDKINSVHIKYVDKK